MRRFQESAPDAAPDRPRLSDTLSRTHVNLPQCDFLLAGMQGLVGTVIGVPIFKIDGRIDSACLHPDGRGPLSRWIGSRYDEISIHRQGCRHIKKPFFIPDRGRPYAAGVLHLQKRKSLRILHTVSDLFPVHQISAVKNRNSRKVFKGACDQIIILPHPANARIRVKAPEHRILILHISLFLPPSDSAYFPVPMVANSTATVNVRKFCPNVDKAMIACYYFSCQRRYLYGRREHMRSSSQTDSR